MKNFTMQDLKRLTTIEDELCISMYMPTDPSAATTDEQRIRFKNLLKKAENKVHESSSQKKTMLEMIEQGRQLMENDYFWRHQSDGLAVFIASEVFLFYRFPVRFEEAFEASTRFAVKPLIPLFMADGRFYILGLSQARVRLFACTRHSVMEIDLVDVPGGLSESLQYDSKESHLQFHTGAAGGGGNRPAVYHGQGVGIDDSKDEILRYFQDVSRSISKLLAGENVPIVLAGVEFLLPIFRQAAGSLWLLEDAVTGNPDDARAEDLHQAAFAVVRPVLEDKQRQAEARYHELAGKGYTASGVRIVVPAAAYGRVETLFVASDRHRRGRFNRNSGEVFVTDESDAGTEDLLELATVETIHNGGSVYVLESDAMPEENAPAAAILRF